MHANKRMELDKVYSGDIITAVGFKITTTGDTICDEQHPVILESMGSQSQLSSWLSSQKTKAGQQKMGEALASWLRRIRPSVNTLIRKLDRPSSLVWVKTSSGDHC